MAFSKNIRFQEPVDVSPGVGSYTPSRPTSSRQGFNKTKACSIFDVKNGVPGPCTYSPDAGDLSKRVRGCGKFVASGKGRVPWPEPAPIPGPNSYQIKHEYKPVILKHTNSPSFISKTKRDSEFSKCPPGPGIGAYKLPSPFLWAKPKNTNKELHTFGADKDRFKNSLYGRLDLIAAIPGVGTYEVSSPLARPNTSPIGFRGRKAKLLGKQNEIGINFGSFGDPKEDRFFNTTFGRLDLAALDPGPGHYSPIK